MYLMCSSRPDIAYSVGRLSRYTHNPGHDHWSALVRLLKYLKGTADFGLSYCGYPPVLEGYCDAKWISESKDIHSTSGYVFTLAGAAVSWRSSKQTCIARSTMESEFIALELAGREAEWLRSLVADIPLWPKPVPSVPLHYYVRSESNIADPLTKALNRKLVSETAKKMGLSPPT
ncbi:secreted RxLR effector protein 161-like [Silene latifolia]|uniref:secreted RxLR effector protein 161-like n=1 Tax=Silene latifolia TaxID=37657 RepID=UPI003D77903F